MVSVKELASIIGKKGRLSSNDVGIVVDVEVLDVRRVWDRTDYQVRPVAGDGKTWVSSARVQLEQCAAL